MWVQLWNAEFTFFVLWCSGTRLFVWCEFGTQKQRGQSQVGLAKWRECETVSESGQAGECEYGQCDEWRMLREGLRWREEESTGE